MSGDDRDSSDMAAFLEVMVEINKGRTWSCKNRVAKAWHISCPKCTGAIHLRQSERNGHVQGACTTPGCFAFIE